MKITGIKKAVGEYKRANSEGWSSPWYGNIMLDREDGHVWTDVFYSLGHNEWMEYRSPSIIDLGHWMNMQDEDAVINMQTVKAAAEKLCSEWVEKEAC